jgi:hypothetical protein
MDNPGVYNEVYINRKSFPNLRSQRAGRLNCLPLPSNSVEPSNDNFLTSLIAPPGFLHAATSVPPATGYRRLHCEELRSLLHSPSNMTTITETNEMGEWRIMKDDEYRVQNVRRKASKTRPPRRPLWVPYLPNMKGLHCAILMNTMLANTVRMNGGSKTVLVL